MEGEEEVQRENRVCCLQCRTEGGYQIPYIEAVVEAVVEVALEVQKEGGEFFAVYEGRSSTCCLLSLPSVHRLGGRSLTLPNKPPLHNTKDTHCHAA